MLIALRLQLQLRYLRAWWDYEGGSAGWWKSGKLKGRFLGRTM